MSEQKFNINRIYVKESSFVTKGAPESFLSVGESTNEMQLKLEHRKLQQENYYEVVLDILVKTKVKEKSRGDSETADAASEGKEVLEIKLKQAGIFQIEGFDQLQQEQLLGAYCPEILYPYARHAVAELSVIGTFPTVTLTPMDFKSLYEQSKKRAQQQEQQATRH